MDKFSSLYTTAKCVFFDKREQSDEYFLYISTSINNIFFYYKYLFYGLKSISRAHSQ